jgi:hypothetical protein
MCVIIVKPGGAILPQNSILERAAIYNPHGFGFCTPNKLYKTLSFEAFMKTVSKIKENEPCIIHFRYATTGSVKRANCHPFRADGIFFAHNGVLNIATKNDMTDSETFFQKDVMPVINHYGYGSAILQVYMNVRAEYSKFAMLKGNEISMYGEYQKIGGCYYSNTRFLNYYYSIR